MADCCDGVAREMKELNDKVEADFLEEVHDYVLYCDSVKVRVYFPRFLVPLTRTGHEAANIVDMTDVLYMN
jgi:hypothetical protein